MRHVWAATAAAVVSVGATAAGTYMSTQAANKAAAAQSAAASKYGKALSQIQLPQWNIARDIKDARNITQYNIGELEEIFPGATSQREIAARATESYLKGEIPKDVQDQIMRSVAELGGAGFAPQQAGVPQVGGFQAAQGLLARQLGLTSLDLQMKGQELSQKWQSIAGAFIESPLQVSQARLGYEKAAADIQLGIAGGNYGAAVNTIGANLAANQALAGGVSSIGSALGGGLSAYGSAKGLQALAASQGAMGGATGTAKYGTPEYARAVSNPNTQYLGVGTKAQQSAMATDTPATVTWLNKAYGS